MDKEMSYTPGPWIAEGATVKAVSHGQWFKVTRADGLRHTKEGNENNARLIAAAPDLLEALETLTAAVNEKEPDALIVFASIERARAAIIKAKGAE